MQGLVLYDLASCDGNLPWSPYSWKVRLALNLKGVGYTTEFLEYPDVADRLKSFGVQPGDPARGHGASYTIPTVRLTNGSYVMESMAIVQELESVMPSLHLDHPILPRVEAAVKDFDHAFYPNFMCKILGVLNKPSREYFDRTRTKDFGLSMAELERTQGGEGPWQNAMPALETIKLLLQETDGPFMLGHTVSYADFVVVAFWQFLRRVDTNAFDRLLQFDQSFARLYEACEKYMSKLN